MSRHIMPWCDGMRYCEQPVTHLDDKGYVYCTNHGTQRAQHRACRAMTDVEIERLAHGQQIERF